jgi:hypothetical protein
MFDRFHKTRRSREFCDLHMEMHVIGMHGIEKP